MNHRMFLITFSLCLLLPISAHAQVVNTGEQAPGFTVQKHQNGAASGTISLSDYNGQVLIIYLFGFGCPSCIGDRSAIENELWQVYKDKGVTMVGLDVWNGEPPNVQNFVGDVITFDVGMKAGDVGLDYAGSGSIQNSFFIIDSEGNVAYAAPQSTHYSARYTQHKQEMFAVLDELTMTSSVEDDASELPAEFALAQNAPNPFKQRTAIPFSLGNAQVQIKLTVYNVLGQEVITLSQQPFAAGRHTIQWNGRDKFGRIVPQGVYFYALETPSKRLVKSLLFLPGQ